MKHNFDRRPSEKVQNVKTITLSEVISKLSPALISAMILFGAYLLKYWRQFKEIWYNDGEL